MASGYRALQNVPFLLEKKPQTFGIRCLVPFSIVLSIDQAQSEPGQYGHTYIRDVNSLPLSTAFYTEMDGKEKDVRKDS